jgi:hypothetical protein
MAGGGTRKGRVPSALHPGTLQHAKPTALALTSLNSVLTLD